MVLKFFFFSSYVQLSKTQCKEISQIGQSSVEILSSSSELKDCLFFFLNSRMKQKENFMCNYNALISYAELS